MQTLRLNLIKPAEMHVERILVIALPAVAIADVGIGFVLRKKPWMLRWRFLRLEPENRKA
jgi:hypothetical protein